MIIPILGISVWFLVKVMVLILMGFYLIFALIVVRQVQLMTDTLQVGFEFLVKLLSYAHLVFAIFVFLSALVIL